ncbi:hypothetical protein COO60DRAFT_801686 [Scenedesmus sp. NREL 46B-D3]|nr:hypothetical protein COO60DRAFT_801686 [Scenedesmus sp. NREL 46B-D3]
MLQPRICGVYIQRSCVSNLVANTPGASPYELGGHTILVRILPVARCPANAGTAGAECCTAMSGSVFQHARLLLFVMAAYMFVVWLWSCAHQQTHLVDATVVVCRHTPYVQNSVVRSFLLGTLCFRFSGAPCHLLATNRGCCCCSLQLLSAYVGFQLFLLYVLWR